MTHKITLNEQTRHFAGVATHQQSQGTDAPSHAKSWFTCKCRPTIPVRRAGSLDEASVGLRREGSPIW